MSGYNKRSRVEVAIGRYEQVIGNGRPSTRGRVRSRKDPRIVRASASRRVRAATPSGAATADRATGQCLALTGFVFTRRRDGVLRRRHHVCDGRFVRHAFENVSNVWSIAGRVTIGSKTLTACTNTGGGRTGGSVRGRKPVSASSTSIKGRPKRRVSGARGCRRTSPMRCRPSRWRRVRQTSDSRSMPSGSGATAAAASPG
jgi:hypothetical protein